MAEARRRTRAATNDQLSEAMKALQPLTNIDNTWAAFGMWDAAHDELDRRFRERLAADPPMTTTEAEEWIRLLSDVPDEARRPVTESIAWRIRRSC